MASWPWIEESRDYDHHRDDGYYWVWSLDSGEFIVLVAAGGIHEMDCEGAVYHVVGYPAMNPRGDWIIGPRVECPGEFWKEQPDG